MGCRGSLSEKMLLESRLEMIRKERHVKACPCQGLGKEPCGVFEEQKGVQGSQSVISGTNEAERQAGPDVARDRLTATVGVGALCGFQGKLWFAPHLDHFGSCEDSTVSRTTGGRESSQSCSVSGIFFNCLLYVQAGCSSQQRCPLMELNAWPSAVAVV